MVYKWKTGYGHKVKADVAGKVCEELESNGGLTAKRLVEASKPKSAPLHNEFEWNNTKAAELYREQQGRNIINSIEIVVEEKPAVRAFFNINVNESRSYEHIDTIVQDEDKTQALLDMALAELEAFRNKYDSIREYIGVVMDDIDNVIERKGSQKCQD